MKQMPPKYNFDLEACALLLLLTLRMAEWTQAVMGSAYSGKVQLGKNIYFDLHIK